MTEILWYLRTMYRPRDTIRHFLVSQPKLEVVFALVVVYGGLALVEELLSGEKLPGLTPLYFVIGWVGLSGGAFLVGRALRGRATMDLSLIALGITFVVPLIFTPVSFILIYIATLLPSENLMTFDLARLILGLAIGLWWLRVCAGAISETHGFDIVRSLLTLVASLVTSLASVGVTMILLVIILGR